jgi:selenocysteine lyase/cysteine desulfurase
LVKIYYSILIDQTEHNMNFDIERARRETPATQHMIHFNNCGASLQPSPVFDAVLHHLNLEASIGGYEAAEKNRDKIEHFYDAAAQLLNCSRSEVAFAENATRAWDMAFYSFDFQPGDRIVTVMAEYASNYLALLQVAKNTGAVIDVIPNDESGQLDIAALENMIDERVKLIAITHVPTNGGLVNPAAEVGRIAKANNIPYLLDACQSAGQMPLDADKLGVDILAVTGRKFLRGPRGTGLLYVRQSLIETLEPPFLELQNATWVSTDRYEMRNDARRFEAWERNMAGQIGLGVAIDYAMSWELGAIYERIQALANGFRCRLREIDGITVRDLGQEQCGIVSFTSEQKDPEHIVQELSKKSINTSTSGKSSTFLDMDQRQLDFVVRAAIHYYNTDNEIDQFIAALKEILL